MSSPGNPVPPGASAPEVLPPPPPIKRKSEAIAFFLSLFFPGAGALYCGKRRAGFWTLGLTALSFVLLKVASLQSSDPDPSWLRTVEILFRLILILCGFAVWDAIASAREVNAGRGQLNRYNPRVAFALNLATRGFGYFYLRERQFGSAAVLLSILIAVAAFRWNNPVLILCVETTSIFFAVHAYRLAKKKNPAVPQSRGARPQPRNAWDYANYGFAALLLLAYVGSLVLVIYVTTFHVDQTTARFAVSDGVSLYENPKEGVKLRLPGVWEKLDDSASLFVQLQSPDKSMNVVFGTFPKIPILTTVDRLSLEMEKQFSREGLTPVNTIDVTLYGGPWRQIELCHAYTTMVQEVAAGDLCENGAHVMFWIWRKDNKAYTLLWVTSKTDDPESRANYYRVFNALQRAASTQ